MFKISRWFNLVSGISTILLVVDAWYRYQHEIPFTFIGTLWISAVAVYFAFERIILFLNCRIIHEPPDWEEDNNPI